MDDLKRQVRSAQRRLILQQWISASLWGVFGALILAMIGIAIRKIWPIAVEGRVWAWSWIGGGLLTGLAVATVYTWVHRRRTLDAAVEIDRRFGLKERISSCLALDENQLHSPAGQALLEDAVRRAGQVDVAQRFQVSANRWAWLPVAAAAIVFGLTLLSDAQPDPKTTAQAATVTAKKSVQNSTQSLKKKVEQQRKSAVEKGLEDAGELFKKIEQGMEELGKRDNVDRQTAMVKLNDLVQEIKDRQEQLGSREEVRKQLNQLKDLTQGPADRMAQAIKDGDFRAALAEVKKLEEQIRKDELSQEDQEKLQQQLDQMRNKLQQMAEAHSQAKRDLEEQIQQKLAQKDHETAGKLQRQLDQLMRQNQQMERLNQMAQKLSQCSECLQNGQAQGAAEQLSDLADGLEQWAQELDELEMLEQTLNEFADARDAMSCPHCSGMG